MKEPQWGSLTVELGTRFSIIPIKTEVVTVQSITPGSCTHCIMRPTSTLGNIARDRGVSCGYLPLCDDKVFLPTTPEYIAKYTAARLTK